MICVRCGQHNQTGARYCQYCSMLLPRLDPDSEITVPKETGLYDRIGELVRRLRAEEISPQEFTDSIIVIFDNLAAKSMEIQDIVYSSNYYRDFPQEVETGFAGIQSIEEGLAGMAQFVIDGDQSRLLNGLELIWEGTEKINEAKRLNRGAGGQLDWNVWG